MKTTKNGQKSSKKTQKTVGRLTIERLENRCLLSGLAQGIDQDGDHYEIRLNGAGTITNENLQELTLDQTNIGSSLIIRVTNPLGDGRVDVDFLDANAADIGTINVAGTLGRLNVGNLNYLQTRGLGSLDEQDIARYEIQIAGNLTNANIAGTVRNADVNIEGNAILLQAGDYHSINGNVVNSNINIDGDLSDLRLYRSLTSQSSITVQGNLRTAYVYKSIINSELNVTGSVQKMFVYGGIELDSQLNVGGDVNYLQTFKTVRQTEISIAGDLTLAYLGNDLADSTLVAKNCNWLFVRDDLDNTNISIEENLQRALITDSRGLTLRVGRSLTAMNVTQDLEDAIISVFNDIGTMSVGQDLNRSTIMAGIDIGNDFVQDDSDSEWGNLTISSVFVMGDMIDSSIAAGINAAAPNYMYGDGDDRPTADDVGTARIGRIFVAGEITANFIPNQRFAISAADGIDLVFAGGAVFTGTEQVLIQQF